MTACGSYRIFSCKTYEGAAATSTVFVLTDGDVTVPRERSGTSTWSDEETMVLMDIWGEEDVQRAMRGFVHNGHVYADISERMHDLGFSKTSEQCRWKVKSLRNNFRQCYERKK